MRNAVFSACGLWCLLVSVAGAEVRLATVFGDSMVVQRGQPIPVWGWADAAEEVTVQLGDVQQRTAAGEDGRWRVNLAAQTAGGPLTLEVRGSNTLTIQDVLVGEVWICSGQSNMEWRVRDADNSEEEIAAADHPQIRQFNVTRKVAETPQDDCEGNWTVCSPDTVPAWTAVGYFFGRELQQKLDVPIGLINTSWGGTLAEAWTSREGLATDTDFQPIFERAVPFQANNPNQACALYNGMLRPLIPYAIRGAIWYQGESNVSRAEQYAELFPAMIRDWRKKWDQGDFPFYFVQLAPFRYGNQDPRACAELWEAQLKTLAVPNTGMAVTMDIGNTSDIHPRNKQEVGRRLALWALSNTYGQDVDFSGPLYDYMTQEGHQVRIHFRYAREGLKSLDDEPLDYFQVAGRDEQFVEAEAKIDGSTVVVSADSVDRPVAVRFAWQDDAEPNLADAHGLPASPFRTDDFEMVTEGRR